MLPSFHLYLTNGIFFESVKISIHFLKPFSQCLLYYASPHAGNMMASVLRKQEGDAYTLVNFNCSDKKETPAENKELEEDFKSFLEKGISRISRAEEGLSVTAGAETRTLTLDNMLKRQDEAKRAALAAPNKNPKRR